MPHIIISEQFFYPEGWGGAQLPRDLSVALQQGGHIVEAVCGADQYAPVGEAKIKDPREDGVRIVRIPRIFGGDFHRHKILRQLWFYIAVIPVMLFRWKPDLYITQTNPPLIVTIVAAIAFIKRQPFIIIAQDLYPEVLAASRQWRGLRIGMRLLTGLLNWSYRRATRVVTLGPKMAELLRGKGVPKERIEIISNWATGELSVVRGGDNILRREWGLDGYFVALYSGNMGTGHEFETILRAVKLVAMENPNLMAVFIGKGKRRQELEDLVTSYGVERNTMIKPFMPQQLLPQSYGLADLALITMREGFEGAIVPSKLLGHMARGIPTIYIGPVGDISYYIEESGSGVCFRNGDVNGVVEVLKSMIVNSLDLKKMGESGRRYYEAYLSRENALCAYRRLTEQVLAEA